MMEPQTQDGHIPNGNKIQNDKSKYGRMDLADFVAEVERFSRLIEPIAFVFYAFEDLRRWKYPVLSLTVWLVCNIGCLVLTKGSVFALVSLLVIFIASTCLIQLHTRILDKVLPSTGLEVDDDDEESEEDESTMQIIKQFRYSLLEMYDFIRQCNSHLEHLYRILKWDNTLVSLRFHVEICSFLLSLVVLPTRGICFMFINWLFLANENVFQYVVNNVEVLRHSVNGKNSPQHKESSNVGVATVGQRLSVEEVEINVKQPESKSKEDMSDMENEPENLEIAPDESDKVSVSTKPGMVARLKEMRRRRQHIANESCFKCEDSFASILKRRYYCRHCGNKFCSKCCNQKVPKSMFGATSPAAQTETVLVCNVCYDLLMNNVDKDKKS